MKKNGCKQLWPSILSALFLGVSAGHAQNIVDLRTMKEIRTTELPGGMVSDAENAKQLAIQAYLDKMEGIRATEWLECFGVILLGYTVDGFALEEDKVWEVRVSDIGNNGLRTLRAILWVHPETGKVHYVCGPWEQGRSKTPEEAETPVAE